jgi:hypothetical protein
VEERKTDWAAHMGAPRTNADPQTPSFCAAEVMLQ